MNDFDFLGAEELGAVKPRAATKSAFLATSNKAAHAALRLSRRFPQTARRLRAIADKMKKLSSSASKTAPLSRPLIAPPPPSSRSVAKMAAVAPRAARSMPVMRQAKRARVGETDYSVIKANAYAAAIRKGMSPQQALVAAQQAAADAEASGTAGTVFEQAKEDSTSALAQSLLPIADAVAQAGDWMATVSQATESMQQSNPTGSAAAQALTGKLQKLIDGFDPEASAFDILHTYSDVPNQVNALKPEVEQTLSAAAATTQATQTAAPSGEGGGGGGGDGGSAPSADGGGGDEGEAQPPNLGVPPGGNQPEEGDEGSDEVDDSQDDEGDSMEDEMGFDLLDAEDLGRGGGGGGGHGGGGHGGHGHGGRGRGRGFRGGAWWGPGWWDGPWYDGYYVDEDDEELAEEVAKRLAKKLKKKTSVGYVAPDTHWYSVATPGNVKDEMDKVYREGETLNADVLASSADSLFKNAWTSFWAGFKTFYNDNASGAGGWLSRLWTGTGDRVVAYGNQLNDWRAKLKTTGGHVTEPELTAMQVRIDPSKINWKPVLIGAGVLGGLALTAYGASKVASAVHVAKKVTG